MKKVLVITYYWPPSGGGGVQRWLKFTKYLPEFGWTPVIYTPKTQNAPTVDVSLSKDVSDQLEIIRTPIWEPYSMYRLVTGRNKKENLGAAFASNKGRNETIEGISNWIRSNFFIPDARKFWIKPSVVFLTNYLKENHVDAVVTTGPPHSMHMIGLGLKEKLGVRWIADFRDPWTDIDYFDELKLTGWAKRRHQLFERNVIKNADFVISISESNKLKLLEKANADINVITNGYDPDDVSGIAPKLDKKFTIAHIGTFMANRNPTLLWQVIKELLEENDEFREDFELILVGKVDAVIIDTLQRSGLGKHTKVIGNVSHEEAVLYQKKSQILLILVNKTGDPRGMVTGKVFEYLVSGRPILAIGPIDGGLATILKETNTGVISDFNDKAGLKRNILNYYRIYKSKMLKSEAKNIEQYSRKNLTGKLADVLNNLVQ